MLRSLLFLAVVLSLSFNSEAQILTIDNNTNCTMQVTVACGHSAPPTCSYCTQVVCIPPLTTGVTVNPCFSDCTEWTLARVCAADDASCNNICTPAGSNCVDVSWNGCFSLPTTGSTTTSTGCGTCANTTFNVDATTANGLKIY